jgi:hypothetical protein
VLGSIGLVAGAAFVVDLSSAGAAPTALFSSSTPGPQTAAVTIPGGICFVSVTADGAGGGTGFVNSTPASLGGFGAEVTARLAVTPGEALTLNVSVGATGADATAAARGAGGFGGGGGGGGDVIAGVVTSTSGGEGGASTVFTAAGAPLLVAGGGGGGGASTPSPGGNRPRVGMDHPSCSRIEHVGDC